MQKRTKNVRFLSGAPRVGALLVQNGKKGINKGVIGYKRVVSVS